MPNFRAKFSAGFLVASAAFVLAHPGTAAAKSPAKLANLQCPPVRLDVGNGSMAFQTVRDQGNVGLCYAEVASQMVDAWRATHVPTSKGPINPATYKSFATSEIYAGLLYSLNQKEFRCPAQSEDSKTRFFEGGKVCETANEVIAAGSCSAPEVNKFLSDRAKKSARRDNRSPSQQHLQLSDLLDTIYEQENSRMYCSLKQQPEPANVCIPCLIKKSAVNKPDAAITQMMFDALPPLQRQEFISFWKPIQEAKAQLEKGPCTFRDPVPEHPRCRMEIWKSRRAHKNLPNEINRRLLAPNAQPIGIGYCSSVLSYSNSRMSYDDWEEIGASNRSKECGPHTSLIIGQRPRNGRCEYLVRNSWGTDISRYSKNWQPDRDSKGRPTGNVWIDSEALVRNTFETYQMR